jgi:cellulose synthase/poly-beta-1,6-N-acetylglucosamine synthase-like glycosyltransferase
MTETLTASTAVPSRAFDPTNAPRLVALLPAHNEAATIADAVAGLRAQTRTPDRIVVVADNCSDDTALLAIVSGAEVFETVGNSAKKAGALNQALAAILPTLDGDDLVLVQDADSRLDGAFLASAVDHLAADATLGAVGGVFRGSAGGGLVGHLQRNEYARYARDVRRLDGQCLVVTGTAAVLRVATLREVSEARLAGALPPGDGRGGVYDTTVLTEDNELTFGLLHLGYRVLSPKECTLETEVMTSWSSLWQQRLRWKRGAVENCVQYGWTPVTRAYWGRQLLTAAGVVVTFLYLGSIAWSLAVLGGLTLQPFWLFITGIFVVERIVTVRDRGWRQMLRSALMYELVYDTFLQVVHGKAYLDAIRNTERRW